MRNRSYAPKGETGPTIGVIGRTDGTATVRVVRKGEGLPGSTVKAADDSKESVAAAVREVVARVKRQAKQAVVLTVEV